VLCINQSNEVETVKAMEEDEDDGMWSLVCVVDAVV